VELNGTTILWTLCALAEKRKPFDTDVSSEGNRPVLSVCNI
jgi:hypothetical protein